MELHERISPSPDETRRALVDPFAEVKNRIHIGLIEASRAADVQHARSTPMSYAAGRSEVARAARRRAGISRDDRERLVEELTDDILGHGPLERLLDDNTVTEIMVNGPYDIWVERAGRLHKTAVRFTDESHLRRIISKIVAQVGRRIDESSPMVDARLPDGSRVNAMIPPLSLRDRCSRSANSRSERLDRRRLIRSARLDPKTPRTF